MTPEQALELLKNMADQANLPMKAHVAAQQAYDTLKKAIEPNVKSDKTALSSVSKQGE